MGRGRGGRRAQGARNTRTRRRRRHPGVAPGLRRPLGGRRGGGEGRKAGGGWRRGRPAPGGAARVLQASTRRRPLPSHRGPPRAVHAPGPRLRPLARSLLPALPAALAEPASPQSLMNIERPLLYFPSSIAEAEARHIVRRRRRPRRLVPESRSGRGQRSPGLGHEPVSGAGGRRRAREPRAETHVGSAGLRAADG